MESWCQEHLDLGPRVDQSVLGSFVIIHDWHNHELINIYPGMEIDIYSLYSDLPKHKIAYAQYKIFKISGVLIVGGSGPESIDKYAYIRRAGLRVCLDILIFCVYAGSIFMTKLAIQTEILRHISSYRWKYTMPGKRGSVPSDMIFILPIPGRTSLHEDPGYFSFMPSYCNSFMTHDLTQTGPPRRRGHFRGIAGASSLLP